MSFRVAYYFAAFAVMLTHNIIFSVKGQPTVQACENGDWSLSIVEEIERLRGEIFGDLNKLAQGIHELLKASLQEMKNQQEAVMTSLQAVDRRSQEQVQGIYEFLNKSFQQMKNQQESAMTSLQTLDRRTQDQNIYIKQVESIHELLNASFEEMKNQQDTVVTSLQTIDRRSQEQDIYIKQVQSIHNLLNASFEQMKGQNKTVMRSLLAIDQRSQEQDIYIKQVQSIHELLNASFQQIKNQHAAAIRRLDVVIQLILYHDISITNQTQNPWKLAIGLPVQLDVDLGDGPVLLPIVNNWIIIIHRFDGSLSFNRSWTEYRNGFGEIGRGEFWLGNEIVHRLTKTSGSIYTLRIEVQLNTSGRWFQANYANFSLDSENGKYALFLSGFSGNAGDPLTNTSLTIHGHHGGMGFSTWNNDNDNSSTANCAQLYQAGWWFINCWHSCLTCQYRNFFKWYGYDGWQSSGLLRAARMMIKSI